MYAPLLKCVCSTPTTIMASLTFTTLIALSSLLLFHYPSNYGVTNLYYDVTGLYYDITDLYYDVTGLYYDVTDLYYDVTKSSTITP